MVKVLVEKNIDVEVEVNVSIRDVLAALPSIAESVDEEGIPLKHSLSDGVNTVYQYMDALTPEHFQVLSPQAQEAIASAFARLANKLRGMVQSIDELAQ